MNSAQVIYGGKKPCGIACMAYMLAECCTLYDDSVELLNSCRGEC